MADESLVNAQRRGRKIAMTSQEVDGFLGAQRTCRLATVSADGPHNAPLWFVWDGGSMWFNSIVRSQRWIDLERDPRVAVVVDAGEQFTHLHGVELRGTVTRVGEAPRSGEPVASRLVPELLFAQKYMGSDDFQYDGRHAWLQLRPDKLSSWDFRKQFPAKPS